MAIRASALSSTRAAPALVGADEQVLEIEAGAAEERRVREEVDGEADGPPPAAADQRLEVRPPPEAVTPDQGRRGLDLVEQPLVLGQAADQLEDDRYVA